MTEVSNRTYTETQDVGPFSLSMSFTQNEAGEWVVPFQMFVTGRGKSGTDLDGWLYELGVIGSKMMQRET